MVRSVLLLVRVTSMNTVEQELREVYEGLKPGDRVEVIHGVTVGSSATWSTTTAGKVLRRERRRHGLHFRRNADDKVYSDELILPEMTGS